MKISPLYQMCTRCVMDTSAGDIRFDQNGVCNYCTEFLERYSHVLREDPVARHERLKAFIDRVKHSGRGKPYDCVVGVSGGVDSSWALVNAVRLGLRPLAVHMDNGWNSELAQNNIANLVRGLNVDLYTHVIDWDEYRGLMQAFFDADVIDIELLYDNAMLAVNFQQASAFGVNFILSGSNNATEGMTMPRNWHAFKFDERNILCIARRNGVRNFSTFPSIGTLRRIFYEAIKGIRWVPFLDHLEYKKSQAMALLTSTYNYKPYPYKHYESIFTRFYQGYILPRKFGVDKRHVHLSTLILTNQLDRNQALRELKKNPLSSDSQRQEDQDYFLKKMKWNERTLEEYLRRPRKEHAQFGSEEALYETLRKIYAFTRPNRFFR